MIDTFVLILFPTTFTVIFVLVARLTSFLKHFALETRCICREMDHADSYEDYWKWRVALRCHYLMLIPFVNKKNVTRVYRRIFHKRDHTKKKERRDSLVPLLLPSILGVCFCMICVCGMTWAWYSASVEAPAQKITAAYYEVKVISVVNIVDGEKVESDGSGYMLKDNCTYTVVLKADGTAKECGGYCLIETGETKLYTQTFKPDEEIRIMLKPEIGGMYAFTGIWGSLPPHVGTDYLNNTAVPSNADNSDMIPNTDDTIPAFSDSNAGSGEFESDETTQGSSQDDVTPETNVPEETTSPVTDVPSEPVRESAVDSTDASPVHNSADHPESDMPDESEALPETTAAESMDGEIVGISG